MANECKVYEMTDVRGRGQVRPMPVLARTALSSGDTVTLTKSTNLVTIQSSIAGTVDFTSTAGVDPTGSLAPFSIVADREYDFSVRPGTKIRFD